MSALAGARPEEAGLASGLVNTSYQVGSALGLAVATAVAASAGFAVVGPSSRWRCSDAPRAAEEVPQDRPAPQRHELEAA